MEPSESVVAVWKSTWLPPSETFVANQVSALTRWHPLILGLRTDPGGLPIHVDRAPFGHGVGGKVARRLSAATRYRYIYDDLLRSSGARLVHAHFGTGAIAALPIARRAGIPLIATFHGYDVTRKPHEPGRDAAQYRKRLAEVFDYATVLIAVSEFIAQRLIALGAPASKVRVEQIGVPLVKDQSGDATREGVVFVGRLVEVKGVVDLISAMALLPERLKSSTRLKIVGYGPEMTSLRQMAREQALDVVFLGRLAPDQVSSTLAGSLLYCGPSRTAKAGDAEGFGMVYLEAALQRLPVVAYRHGGVPEAVQDGVTGLLADEGDVAALSRNIALLLEDPGYASSMGTAGRGRVVKEFDIDQRSARLESIYDEVTTLSVDGQAVRRYSS